MLKQGLFLVYNVVDVSNSTASNVWAEYGRQQCCPNFKYCLGICLEGLKKIANCLGQNNRCCGQDSKGAPTEYKSEASLLQTTYAVNARSYCNFTAITRIYQV